MHLNNAAIVSRDQEGIGIDIVYNGEIRQSRLVTVTAAIEAEVCRTYSLAGLPCGETVCRERHRAEKKPITTPTVPPWPRSSTSSPLESGVRPPIAGRGRKATSARARQPAPLRIPPRGGRLCRGDRRHAELEQRDVSLGQGANCRHCQTPPRQVAGRQGRQARQ